MLGFFQKHINYTYSLCWVIFSVDRTMICVSEVQEVFRPLYILFFLFIHEKNSLFFHDFLFFLFSSFPVKIYLYLVWTSLVLWGDPQTNCICCILLQDLFHLYRVIQDNIVLISRALRHQFVIPEWLDFISHIEEFYWSVKGLTGGKVSPAGCCCFGIVAKEVVHGCMM